MTRLSGKDNQNHGEGSQVNGLQTEELMQLREQVEELRKQSALLQTQLGDKDALINNLVRIHIMHKLRNDVGKLGKN